LRRALLARAPQMVPKWALDRPNMTHAVDIHLPQLV
jgi:hypothetical protein